jgi:hypothetical protein
VELHFMLALNMVELVVVELRQLEVMDQEVVVDLVVQEFQQA